MHAHGRRSITLGVMQQRCTPKQERRGTYSASHQSWNMDQDSITRPPPNLLHLCDLDWPQIGIFDSPQIQRVGIGDRERRGVRERREQGGRHSPIASHSYGSNRGFLLSDYCTVRPLLRRCSTRLRRSSLFVAVEALSSTNTRTERSRRLQPTTSTTMPGRDEE